MANDQQKRNADNDKSGTQGTSGKPGARSGAVADSAITGPGANPATPVSASGANPQSGGQQSQETGLPGGGKGRTDVVGVQAHGVFPTSGPTAPGDATPQGMASFGQGDRGTKGFSDSGQSEVFTMPPKGGEPTPSGMDETFPATPPSSAPTGQQGGQQGSQQTGQGAQQKGQSGAGQGNRQAGGQGQGSSDQESQQELEEKGSQYTGQDANERAQYRAGHRGG